MAEEERAGEGSGTMLFAEGGGGQEAGAALRAPLIASTLSAAGA